MRPTWRTEQFATLVNLVNTRCVVKANNVVDFNGLVKVVNLGNVSNLANPIVWNKLVNLVGFTKCCCWVNLKKFVTPASLRRTAGVCQCVQLTWGNVVNKNIREDQVRW